MKNRTLMLLALTLALLGGVPVATMAIGGGRNAGLMAVKILGAGDPALRQRLKKFMAGLAAESRRRGVKLAVTLKDFTSAA